MSEIPETASLVEDQDSLQSQYLVFKKRALDLLRLDGGDYGQLHDENKHILWKTHKCTSECNVRRHAQCQNYQKLSEPRQVRTMKVLHLFLKTPELYEGLVNIIDLYVSVATKTHAEGVAESVGNFVDIHGEKKGVWIFLMLESKPLSTGMDLQSPILLLC